MTINTNELKSIFPDSTFIASDVAPEALILKVTTHGGAIEGDAPVVRVPYVSDLPDVYVLDEGEAGQVSEPVFDEILINTQKLMLLSKMSREASLHNVSANLLAQSMGTALTRKANQSFLNGMTNKAETNTTAGLVDLAGSTATADLVSLDPVIDLMTTIETAGGHPTDIITDPETWATIRKLKAATGSNMPLIGTAAQNLERNLFGCNVYVSSDMPADTLLVADRRAVISVTGGVELTTSSDVFFDSDTIARRLVWRIGWDIVHPERVGKLTIPAA